MTEQAISPLRRRMIEDMSIRTKASTSAQLEEPKAPQHACPCCGSRMRIIETFWPGQQPKHHSSPLPRPIRIDTS